jgi:chromosome segregation protein
MHLDKLEIKGFKSFREKTFLEFPDRFTAIVGPNGSGKSNIIDSICFVLGRSRGLRVANIAELICNGGPNIKACSEAKVTLHLSDPDKKVKVSREIDRSGKSQYRIDDKAVTRQEVIEIMGDNEYNIILQGDVTRVIDMKPKERRKIIDDICGIAEYDEKKEKALNELEKVELRINEVSIVIGEKNGYLKELEKEKDEAIKYQEYQTDLKRSQATVYALEVQDFGKRAEKVGEKIAKMQSDKEKNNGRITEINAEVEEKNAKLKEANSQILAFEEKKGAAKIIETKSEIQRAQDRQNSNQEALDKVKLELAEEKKKKLELAEEDKKIDLDIKKLAKEIEPLVIKIKEESEKIVGFEGGKELDKARAQIVEMKSKIALTTDISSRDSSEIKKLEDERTELEEKNSEMLGEEKTLARSIDESVLKNKSGFQEYENLRHEQPVVDQRLYEINKALKEIEIRRAEKRTERETIEKTSGNLGSAVNAILGLKEKGMIEGINGTVAQLGRVSDTKYEKALQVAAGGGRLQSIVVEDEKVAAKCIDYLKKKKIGRATFLPLTKINVRVSENAPDESVGFARDFIECPKKFEKIFEWVYQDTILVKDLDKAMQIGINRWRMVTIDGDLTTKEGAMTGGHSATGDAAIKFTSTEDIDKEIEDYEKLFIKLDGDRQELEIKKKKIAEKIAKLEGSVSVEKTEIEKIRLSKEDITRRREESKKTIAGIEDRIDALKKNIALGGETIKKLSRDIEVEEKRIEKAMKNAPKIDMSALEAIRNEKDNKEIEKNTLEERKRNNTAILSELVAEIEKLAKEQSEFEEAVKSAKEQISKFEGELKVLEKENEKLIKEIEKLIETRRKIEESITKIEKESAQLSFDIGRFNEEISKLEVEKARIETELSGVQKQYEQFAGVETFTDKDLAEVRKLAHDLERKINSLGNVNMRAIESFEALKKEIDEVNAKLETLKTERQSIFDFMAAVEQKKMETFMKAFEVVRTNFEKIYHELASGEGTLILDNPRDISDSGLLITASPKGKKLMNIDLMSGGEKTLTTSAFLLSIQRYKPSHFYMVDELDAALDRENSARLAEMLSKSTEAQFLLITHNEALMKYAQAVIGISMVGGVSQIVGVKLAPAAGNETEAVTA